LAKNAVVFGAASARRARNMSEMAIFFGFRSLAQSLQNLWHAAE
jgi:hypothetical protein